jgi:hypothetical protein
MIISQHIPLPHTAHTCTGLAEIYGIAITIWCLDEDVCFSSLFPLPFFSFPFSFLLTIFLKNLDFKIQPFDGKNWEEFSKKCDISNY